jgi:hypothetical protein
MYKHRPSSCIGISTLLCGYEGLKGLDRYEKIVWHAVLLWRKKKGVFTARIMFVMDFGGIVLF